MVSRIAASMAVALLTVVGAESRAQEPKAPAASAPAVGGNGRVAAGNYVEIDSTGRANWGFGITAQEVTPNIIHLRGRNGWVAFASFDAVKKEYRGFFEWQEFVAGRSPGGKWADLYQIRLVVRDGVLRLEGKSTKNEMVIRAKSVQAIPAKAVPELPVALPAPMPFNIKQP